MVSTPSAAGSRAAELVISSNAVETTKRIPLSSSGIAVRPRDLVPHAVTISVPRQTLRAMVKRGLKTVIRSSEAARLRVRLGLSRSLARRLRMPAAYIGARGSATLSKAGKVALRLKLSRRLRTRLRGVRRVRLVLRATATDAAGNQGTATRALRMKR